MRLHKCVVRNYTHYVKFITFLWLLFKAKRAIKWREEVTIQWREEVTIQWREEVTIQWREEVTIQWDDDDDVLAVLDQHAE